MAIPFYNQVDQDIYAGGEHFIPQEKYRLGYSAPLPMSETETVTQGFGIPYTNAFTGGGGGGGNTNQLIGDFYGATANRQKALENPNWLGTQVNKLGLGQRSVKDMITPPTGNYSRSIAHTKDFGLDVLPGAGQYGQMPGVIEGDVRRTSGIPLGIGSMIARMMPDKYYDMDPANQAYIQSQMGYSGPTIFGENTMGNKDPFGRNVRSAFGDYGAAQQKSIDKMDELVKSDVFTNKYGTGLTLEEDEEGNWSFVGPGAARANKMHKLNLQRYSFDRRGIKKRDLIKHNVATQKKMRDAWEAETGREQDEADKRFADTGDYDEYSGAGGSFWGGYPEPDEYTYAGSDEEDEAANYAPATGGQTGQNGGGQTQGQRDTAAAQKDDPGLGGHKKGGRIGYFDGGIARLL